MSEPWPDALQGAARSVPVDTGGEPGIDVVLDVDANGRLVGVEVLGARRMLAPEVLAAARRLDR